MKKRERVVFEDFGYVIEDNFNPDMVHCGLLDCFDEGYKTGFIHGFIFSASLFAGVKIVKKIKEKRDEKN